MATHPDDQKVSKWVRRWDEFTYFLRSNILYSALIGLGSIWLLIARAVYVFEKDAQGANITSYGEAVWWGIVTFLTVGYGDRYPVSTEGRILSAGLMITGVLVTGIVTAKISTYFLEQALLKGRGLVNTESLKNHFIICGWKQDLHELLGHILDFNPDLKAEQIVIIAHLDPNTIENLRGYPRLKGLQFIFGDYFQEVSLRRAAPERARKVFILADQTPGTNGQAPSVGETDAKTIMTAMTLASLAPKTLVAAEVLDSKMDHYLKLAHVNEIIYSREYSRLLLSNAAGGTGVANIIFDLLDPHTPTVIKTRHFRDHYIGMDYKTFKAEFEKEYPKCVVIGLLENTGNSVLIKEMALRQAQKTPDVNKLVQNLKGVRQLRCNHPVFNPEPDYVIIEGSAAIVIETRNDKERKNVGSEEAVQAA